MTKQLTTDEAKPAAPATHTDINNKRFARLAALSRYYARKGRYYAEASELGRDAYGPMNEHSAAMLASHFAVLSRRAGDLADRALARTV